MSGKTGEGNDETTAASNPKLWSTRKFFSTLSSTLSQETDAEPSTIDDNVPSVLKPLVSELQQAESARCERLEPLLMKVMKSCHKEKDATVQVSSYLLENQNTLHSLSSLARNILKGIVV